MAQNTTTCHLTAYKFASPKVFDYPTTVVGTLFDTGVHVNTQVLK